MCNPRVEVPEGRERQLDDSEEGCLSYPGAFVDCARPDFARVTGQGLDVVVKESITGPLGMGHVVLHVDQIDRVLPFYQDLLGFRLSDFWLRPFRDLVYTMPPFVTGPDDVSAIGEAPSRTTTSAASSADS